MSRALDEAQALFHQGRLTDAADLCRKVIRSNPKEAAALHLLGIVRWKQGEPREGVDLLRKAAARLPMSADIQTLLGVIHQELGEPEKALRHFERAYQTAPQHPAHAANLGYTLALTAGDAERAEQLLRRAVAAVPNNAQFHRNLAHLLDLGDRPAEAEREAAAALALDPAFPEACITMTRVLRRQGRLREALAVHERAVAAAPQDAEAHWNKALVHLLLGEFEEGWREAEWRFRAYNVISSVYPQPVWDGTPAPDRSLLVHHEQGFGDTIQLVRLLPLLKGRVGRVAFVAQAPLARLLEGLPGIDELVVGRTDRPVDVAADLQIPLLSLAGILGITLETIPARVPYLAAPPWSGPPLDAPGLKVGLAWQGSTLHRNDRARSCRIEDLAPLFAVDGVSFYSLQYGQPAPPPLLGLDLHDFADTAALMARLDLVIAVDTAVIHLAGALGRPVWSLHAFHADWRWLLDRDDSPWYPTMRLFRQERPGDWAGVMARVAAALGGFRR